MEEKKLTIMNDKGRLTNEELEMHIQQAEATAEEDKLVKERVDAFVNGVEGYAYHVKGTLSEDGKVGDKLGAEAGDAVVVRREPLDQGGAAPDHDEL